MALCFFLPVLCIFTEQLPRRMDVLTFALAQHGRGLAHFAVQSAGHALVDQRPELVRRDLAQLDTGTAADVF